MTRKVSPIKVECLRKPLQFLSRLWYNIPAKGDDTMSEARIDANTARRRYSFMMKKISLSRYLLDQWFDVPEFVDGLVALDNQQREINNDSVLELMESIYESKSVMKKLLSRDEFGFRNAKHSINSLASKISH